MGNNAPEIPLNKTDVDRIFSCNKVQWQQATTQMTAAPGWNFRAYDHQDGTQITLFDQSTGKRMSIQPLFFNDRSLPTMVVVGNYFPLNSVPPMTEKMKREIETAVQENIGPAYSLKLRLAQSAGIRLAEICSFHRGGRQCFLRFFYLLLGYRIQAVEDTVVPLKLSRRFI